MGCLGRVKKDSWCVCVGSKLEFKGKVVLHRHDDVAVQTRSSALWVPDLTCVEGKMKGAAHNLVYIIF
jgi:hypothetical protein